MTADPKTAPPVHPPGAGDPAGGADPQRWIALAVVLSAAFMQLVDISIVNVAIRTIQRDLGASYGQIQLVIAFYQLGFAAVLITGGRLGDIAGRRRMFMIGMTGFTLASLACGIAPTATWLIAFRTIQGLASALMFPQVFSVIQASFPPAERGRAFGITGATIGVATIAGPLIGGLLIQADVAGLQWRPIFLVNVPVGVLAVAAAARFLNESRAPGHTRLDLAGVAVATPGLMLLVYPLVEGRAAGWPAWAFASMGASVLVLAGFWLLERRTAARGGHPLVLPDLFGDRAFSVGLVISFVFFLGIGAYFLTFTIYLQVGLGFSALGAGLTTLPFAIGTATGSAFSVRAAPRLGKRVLALGSALMTLGMLSVIGTVHLAGIGLHSYQFIPAQLLTGIGMGFFVAPMIDTVLAGIGSSGHGSASGSLSTAQQVGGAVGVAMIGVIFFGLLGAGADRASATVTGELRSDLVASGVPARLADQITADFRTCFRDRTREEDPDAVPPSCRATQPPPGAAAPGANGGSRVAAANPAFLGKVIAPAAETARRRVFTDTIQRTLFYEVAVFATTFGLVWLLPDREPHAGRRPAGAPAA